VLDLSLPRKDGTEVLEEMRGRFDETAVLVLTGRSHVDERVKCLNLGADDCLLKPFSFHELTARCRALLRRREQFADPVLRHGDVEMNRMERKVVRNGRLVELTVKEFSLLEFLLMRRGRCCSRSELLREVVLLGVDALREFRETALDLLGGRIVHRKHCERHVSIDDTDIYPVDEERPGHPLALVGRRGGDGRILPRIQHSLRNMRQGRRGNGSVGTARPR